LDDDGNPDAAATVAARRASASVPKAPPTSTRRSSTDDAHGISEGRGDRPSAEVARRLRRPIVGRTTPLRFCPASSAVRRRSPAGGAGKLTWPYRGLRQNASAAACRSPNCGGAGRAPFGLGCSPRGTHRDRDGPHPVHGSRCDALDPPRRSPADALLTAGAPGNRSSRPAARRRDPAEEGPSRRRPDRLFPSMGVAAGPWTGPTLPSGHIRSEPASGVGASHGLRDRGPRPVSLPRLPRGRARRPRRPVRQRALEFTGACRWRYVADAWPSTFL